MPIVLVSISLLCLIAAAICVQDVTRELLANRLAPEPGLPVAGPLVSVLIPARDEASRIGACLGGLASQDYRSYEVIVVDDHSSDGTADIARGYADALPALSIVTGAPLPAGWAGKPWACQQAAGGARGEWLLFLDADVAPKPALLGALVAHAQRHHLDLLTVMPLLRLGSVTEHIVLPAFMALLYGLYPIHEVSDPHSPVAFANGQCLFIHRAAYESLGGHASVRGSILEDTELGQRAKAGGARLAAGSAPDLIEVRMYTDWPSLSEGLGKNAVAGYQSGGGRSAWVGARQALVAFLPIYLLVIGGALALARPSAPIGGVLIAHGAALAIVGLGCWGWLARRRYRAAVWWGAFFPLGTAIYFWLAARALVRLRTGRGVVWKGRRFG
jgi:chlorobactene glucosyltransferase